MSSTPQKPGQKMCKSPKSSSITYQNSKPDKIIVNEYEHLSTNCTVVGSNNLHLVKKPQILTSVSPAYSNPSPGYPPSPYSSPASLKSPSPSLKPPTPQPQGFPVMQIIHNNPLLARPIQTGQQQNIIKLKPHLNILPKPSASPQPSPKPSVSPQIVIPTNQQTTIMPTAQPLLLNQMPMLTPGVQFILRPQPTKIPTQMPTATATPQGLILQPGGQPLLQLQPPRSQPMVRVLTNGMQLAPPTTTYVTQLANQAQVVNTSSATGNIQTTSPKKKPKKKKQKLDLANIMKLSGIGDEDDIQFESDTSQSESEPNNVHSHPSTPQPQQTVIQQTNIVQNAANLVQSADSTKKIGNIQISAVAQPTISATATPLLQVLNQNFQSGMLSNSTTQAATAQGIPFNPFITPNFTINNGLMVQRSGGFKLTVGEDGRLVLQHDPTLNQDLQSQLLLQSIFGLNGGGLVLQPSMDQQVHSQTVQTIQQQSVQTIQQQTVQSQTIQTVQQQTVQPQTVQHSLQTIQQTIQPQIQTVQPQTVQQTVQQTIQHQTVQSQPLSALQGHSQPMQIVQPQPIQNMQPHSVASLHPQQPAVHSIQSQVQSLQIQGQIQSLLQSQPLQTIQSQPIHTHAAVSRNISQPIQTIQSQTVQTQPIQSPHSIQQQTVHSQPIQNIHTHQTVQTQPVLKVQPFQKSQPPVHAVHPQPIQTIHHQPQQHENHQTPAPTSYVVNLTPDQLEQLKRNGQLTVNGQTIYMQRPNAGNKMAEHLVANNENKNKLSPKMKTIKKVNKIQSGNVKTILQDNIGIKTINNIEQVVKESKSSLITALQTPPKHILPQNHVQIQPQPNLPKQTQPSALVTPSVQNAIKIQTQQTEIHQKVQQKSQGQQQKVQVHPNVQNAQTQMHGRQNETNGPPSQDVERLLGQLLDDNGINNGTPNTNIQTVPSANVPQQRVHTIQLTPQKQQHLKSIQLQIQTLSARLTPGDTEMQSALKLLFAEQQKILASGKLLPPAIYHNNQLTIVNPSSLNLQAQQQLKSECTTHTQTNAQVQRSVCNEAPAAHQVVTTQSQQTPRITVTVPVNDQHPAVQQQHNLQHTNTTQPVGPRLTVPQPQTVPQPAHQQNRFIPSFTKEQLIEQQLNTDQNGAVKPDVHTPFRDKADACKRLIRYHCFDQPVLSQKDLDKADEIFELTAKHFIDKFSRMVDKYKYLLLKESMRQVQTSELMMLDRMFLAEEQQSLLRLRQDLEELPPLQFSPPPVPPPQPPTATPVSTSQTPSSCSGASQPDCLGPEEYDEWACIQRELGCLSTAAPEEPPPRANNAALGGQQHLQPPKRSASSDSRLETLKRFRVEKHNKKCVDSGSASVHQVASSATTSTCISNSAVTTRSMQLQGVGACSQQQQGCIQIRDETEPENNSIDEQVQSAIDSILNLQQNTSLDLDEAVSSILS